MKKLLPTLLAIILTVVIFTGCKSILPYNDYDDLDTVEISLGEKLYQSINEWTRLDSVTIDYSDTTFQAWFTFQVYDSLFSKKFKKGDHQIYSFDDLSSKLFSFQCLEIDPYLLDRYGTIGYQVTFIASSNDMYMVGVDKPNIYLYPTKKTRMTVSLDLPEGGKITESIPAYPKKWKNIRVKSDGTINNKYDFLFYEADLPDIWQYDEGWVIAKEYLPFFFKTNLRDYGFNKKEIADFMEYWIPRMKEAPYYAIYPQHTAAIDRLISLIISKQPDSILRLFYIFKPLDKFAELQAPEIPPFERKGFTVTEWGVVLK
ncbi:MAG: hypothetical protein KAU44_01520 [Candidatus Marinimicrobia bacterium]|nr:hypothetical protein [Candidatus Neomarinimicrobiota bacterium]